MPKKQAHRRDGIYERKDRPGFWGSWIDATGRRVQRKLNAPTITQARQLLSDEKAKVERQLVTGIVAATKDTFEDFASDFIEYQRRRIASKPARFKLSQAEFDRQKGIIESHLRPFFGTMKLALIRRKEVNAYIDSRVGKVSDGTVIKEINCLKRLFSVAVSKEKISANPAHGADIPQAPEGRVRYVTREELGRVLRSCPEWLRPIVGLLVTTGARRGEMLRARWEDVNLASREILLRHTKNGKERPAFINDLALQVLESMGAKDQTCKGLLFPGVTPAQVSVAFIRACRNAEIMDFSLHDLRHTFASHSRMSGVDLHTLKTLMGHSDTRMTDRYAHLSQTFLLDAAKRLDGALSLVPAEAVVKPTEAKEAIPKGSIVTVELPDQKRKARKTA